MGIYSAFSIGRTALVANQAALEVVGNNIANASTPNYSRQVPVMVPGPSLTTGMHLGTGVRLEAVTRVYDTAVESRLRDAISNAESTDIQEQMLDRIESLYNETTDTDLSSALTNFFNSFSELANDPQDLGVRTIVVENCRQLAEQIQSMRDGLDTLRQEANYSVNVTTQEINRLAEEIADLNVQVLSAEEGQVGSAPNLRDQRDSKIRELAELIEVRVVELDNGQANIIVGNQVLVDGRYARELTTKIIEDRNLGVYEVRFSDNDELVSLTGGALQGYIASRDSWAGEQVDTLDQLAQALIFETNLLHAEGIGLLEQRTVRSNNFVMDSSAVLNSDDAGLYNTPQHGSFLIHVTNTVSGMTETSVVTVDLDGLGGDDTLDSVAAKLDALDNVDAYVDATGHLVIEGSTSEISLSFTEDSSQLLACMGVNSLFSGYDSVTIGLCSSVLEDPRLLAAGLTSDAGDNANALRLAALADTPLASLGNTSLLQYHNQAVTRLAVNTAAARSSNEAVQSFLSTMNDEREAISGVSLDEEAVSLIRYQKAYTAAARYMSTLTELLDEIMDII
ncbi:MAG: flagellar hook-associated protein FlgK [Planctomycetes bacterium]|nr:flagellar hook-associated protein FlgK [Planctomycetota bacterium]